MSNKLIKVPPTKNTLLSLKKQVRFLEEGHDLLERKRELLTRLVYERIGEYRRLRAEAERQGFGIMVGCMVGSSLAMAPAMLVAQGADLVDLDGPLLLAEDRVPAMEFDEWLS